GAERTVMLSTHNLAEVEQACARAIIVSRGRVVADGPLDEIRAKSGRVRYVVSIQESAGTQPYRGQGELPRKADVEIARTNVKGDAEEEEEEEESDEEEEESEEEDEEEDEQESDEDEEEEEEDADSKKKKKD